jgi:hypothetical protein
MKATVVRNEGRFIVDLWDENLNARSVTIAAREGEGGMELEIATARALIIISEEEVTIKNKQGDEVTVLLPD